MRVLNLETSISALKPSNSDKMASTSMDLGRFIRMTSKGFEIENDTKAVMENDIPLSVEDKKEYRRRAAQCNYISI